MPITPRLTDRSPWARGRTPQRLPPHSVPETTPPRRERRHARVVSRRVAPPTVLLVEDDPTVARPMRQLLVHLGARVVEATNGQEALDRLAAANPDLVLGGLRMPVMDGYEFARRVRSDPAWRHPRSSP